MDQTFLSLVPAASGRNCLVGFVPREDGSGESPQHEWLNIRNPIEVAQVVNRLTAQGATSFYFATGAYKPNEKGRYQRRKELVTGFRSFWLDLDAGPVKAQKRQDLVYQTADEAYTDLVNKLSGVLPKPTYIINSGFGIHAYWVCTEDIDPFVWLALAESFKQYCQGVGLKQDTTRTSDRSSIMRIPGSFHQGASTWASVREANMLFTSEQLIAAFSSLPPAHNTTPTTLTNPTDYEHNDLLVGVHRKPCSFEKIMMLHEYDGTGCRALHHIYSNQERQSYHDWVAILSVAKYCVDGQEWIHKVSSGYPGYSYEATEKKAASLQGVFKCSDIQALDPSRCAGCPLAGKITSPITIGRDPENKPTKVIAPLGTDQNQKTEFIIPEYPWPFYRGINGGIYRRMDDETDDPENAEEMCVFPYDFYIYERINSCGKQLYWCRYHSPHDGVKEFDLDSTMVHTVNDKLKDKLTGQGMAITSKKQWNAIGMFLTSANAKLVASRAALREVTQQGWQVDDRGRAIGFVHGLEEVTLNGTKPAPIGDRHVAVKMSRALKPKLKSDTIDSLDLWNACLANLYGHRDALPGQMIICSSLGSVFASRYAMNSHCGGIISITSAGSGRGKTFACQTALRVWGNPGQLTFASKDGITPNALMTILGYMNSIPLLRDEITEMDSFEMADLVYDSTRLGDKERAQGSENDIRANRNSWRTFFYATANNSIYDAIGNNRDNGDGVMMRVTEMTMPPLAHMKNKREAAHWASAIEDVHGVAGRMLVEWMMVNPDAAEKLWHSTLDEVVARFNIDHPERFWATHLTAAVVGACIGEQLHLHPFSASAVFDFCGELLSEMRQRVAVRTSNTINAAHTEPNVTQDMASTGSEKIAVENATDVDFGMDTVTSLLDEFFVDSQPFTLVVRPHGQTKLPLRGQTHVRIDEEAKRIYIVKNALKGYSRAKGVSLDVLMDEVYERGGTEGITRLLSGTEFAGANPSIRVWILPLTQESVMRKIDPEQLLNL